MLDTAQDGRLGGRSKDIQATACWRIEHSEGEALTSKSVKTIAWRTTAIIELQS
jgi:hypothetical protein